MLTFPSYPWGEVPRQAAPVVEQAGPSDARSSALAFPRGGHAMVFALLATLAAFATTLVVATTNDDAPALEADEVAAPTAKSSASPAPAPVAAKPAPPTVRPAPPAAAPAGPPTDSRGFVNSTARCEGASALAALGRTQRSLIVICKLPDGRFEYGGVRITDGASLRVGRVTATPAGFIADNDGATYDVSSRGLVVKRGNTVLVSEPMLDYRTTP